MKTIMKTLFVVISSFALLSSANAGEMTVTGSAKATWSNISEGQANKGLGIANELTFGASGEFGSGYTWNLAIALDPTTSGSTSATDPSPDTYAGSAINDDTSLNVGLPGMGTLGLHVSAGGFNAKYGWASDAYTVMTDTGASEGASYSNDLGGTANIQFATEAGLLPLGAVIQAGYGYAKIDGQSANTSGVAQGNSATAVGLTLSPVAGLKVGATYHEVGYYNAGGQPNSQDEQSGAAYAKYAAGPITVGYGKSWKAPALVRGTMTNASVEWYENTGYSIGFAVNEQVTVSYSHEKNEQSLTTSTTATSDIKQNSYQIAYNIGGATLSLVRHEADNVAYTANKDTTETLIALAMAF